MVFMRLTFRDKALEADFAAYFGFRQSQTTFLLSAVMTLVWVARFGSLQTKNVPFGAMLSAVYTTMIIVHTSVAVIILRNASVCSSETRKARIWLLDAMACMFTVILFVEREDLRHEPKRSLLLVSSPVIVYSIHGWSVPFAGFRLVADLFLHALNLQAYVTMKIQQKWVQGGPIDVLGDLKTGCIVFCFNSIIPFLVNLVYEANVRSAFLAQRGLSQQILPYFWLTVLKKGLYVQMGA